MKRLIKFVLSHKIWLTKISSRIMVEVFILSKLYQETGTWTLIFAILVIFALEFQVAWNTLQSKHNDLIMELITKKDIETFFGKGKK